MSAQNPNLHVAMASPEIIPFAKTGGLADVVGSLPLALEKLGLKVSLVMPAYRSVLKGRFPLEETGIRFSVPISNRRPKAVVLKTKVGQNISVYLIRADRYFDRDHLYGTPEGDHPDNAERFTFFSRALLEVLRGDPPQILHCHDWQSALAICFLKAQPHFYPELSTTKTVITIHNLGYQGLFWHPDWHLLNLDPSLFSPRFLEFYGKINFLKGGIVFADAITTVSPTYAKEIQTPDQGFGLDGVFRERAADVIGILNGADYQIWNPETDPFISKKYSVETPSGKRICKTDLQRRFGLPEKPEVPLIGMITRGLRPRRASTSWNRRWMRFSGVNSRSSSWEPETENTKNCSARCQPGFPGRQECRSPSMMSWHIRSKLEQTFFLCPLATSRAD